MALYSPKFYILNYVIPEVMPVALHTVPSLAPFVLYTLRLEKQE